jgi:prophage regulatory protein|tara:strand:+ start:154 stop:357 length:204 start_codon:yes stop_codon:yes gene_type:complete
MDAPHTNRHGDRILRAADAARKLGLGRTSFYNLLKEENFPRPIALGTRARGYSEHELDEWINSRPRA